MSITTICTACGVRQPLEAGLIGDDAKLLAGITAVMDPVVARAALGYLRLFKPPGSELRLIRAVKILRELHDLVRAGTVSADERSALTRPATAAMWAAAIEQLLAHPPGKLENHNYLRKVVWGLADKSDALQERQGTPRAPAAAVVTPAPAGSVQDHLDWLGQQLRFGRMSQTDHDRDAAAARERAT